jgi:hypothetical protein
MSTYRELIYLVSDEIKTNSDDSIITEEHIKFLLQKYRAYLIYQKYKDIKKDIPESAYQSICLTLEVIDTLDGEPCVGEKYLRSKEKIPTLLRVGNPQIYPYDDYYQGNITYISRERMRFVGYNRFLKNIIYCSLSPNGHLYFKSSNPQFLYLEKVGFTGVFENPEDASKLTCSEDSDCDILDKEFPIEESLIPMLIGSVVKELLGAAYRPEDSENNASDDLANLATFLRNNIKNDIQKKIEGT